MELSACFILQFEGICVEFVIAKICLKFNFLAQFDEKFVGKLLREQLGSSSEFGEHSKAKIKKIFQQNSLKTFPKIQIKTQKSITEFT